MKLKLFNKKKEPTLTDLAMVAGRILVLRNHDKYISLGNGVCLSYEGHIRLSVCVHPDYTTDLYPLNDVTGATTVMAIYERPYCLQEMHSLDQKRLIWERS